MSHFKSSLCVQSNHVEAMWVKLWRFYFRGTKSICENSEN